MDRLQSMRVFERVVSEGSFAGAARALDMSPPVVTRLVADLEAHLGTRLLQRSTRSISLTAAGATYLSRVRGILQEVDEADDAVRAESRDLAGTLRVHVPMLLMHYLVGPSLVSFREQYPRIRLDIEFATNPNPAIEEFDATLMVVDQNFNAAVVARKLAEGDIVLAASPEYLKRRGKPKHPEDLTQHDCLRVKDMMTHLRTWRLWREDNGEVVDVPVQPVIEANQNDLLLTAALGGAGITSCSLVMAAPHLAAGRLVRVLSPWTVGRFSVYAAMPSRKFIPRRTQVFLDFLVTEANRLLETARHTIEMPEGS